MNGHGRSQKGEIDKALDAALSQVKRASIGAVFAGMVGVGIGGLVRRSIRVCNA